MSYGQLQGDIELVDIDIPRPIENLAPAAPQRGDDDDGIAPAPIFHSPSKTKLLHVSPALLPFQPSLVQWTLHQLIYAPAGLVATLWLASVVHWIVVDLYEREIALSTIAWAPLILSTITTLVLILQLKRGIRALECRFCEGLVPAWLPLHLTMVAAGIIVAMFAEPLYSYSGVVTSNRTSPSTAYVEVPFATLSSWSQVADNMEGFLTYSTTEGMTWPLTSWWSNMSREEPAQLLPTLTFSSTDRNSEQNETILANLIGDHNGLYMPVLPLEPPDASFRESEVRVKTTLLAMRLNCTHATVEDPSVTAGSRVDMTSLSVGVQDPETACKTNLTMLGLRLGEKLRGDLIGDLNQPPMVEWDKNVLEFRRKQLKFLLDYPHLISFAPGWSPFISSDGEQGQDACKHRLAIAGLSRAFFREETIDAMIPPDVSLFEAAICEPQFLSRETELFFHRERVPPFRKGVSWDQPVLGELVRAESEYTWETVSEVEDARLWKALLVTSATAATALARNEAPSWPRAVLGVQVATLMHSSDRPVSALLLAGRWLRQSLLERLAIASEMTLRESIGNGIMPVLSGNESSAGDRDDDSYGPLLVKTVMGQDRPGMRVVRQVAQAHAYPRIILQLLLWSLILAAYISPGFFFISSDDWVPWPLDSLVSQALLLYRSPLRDTLRNLAVAIDGQEQDQDNVLHVPGKFPEMRIGYWCAHRKAGGSGWRLDSHSISDKGVSYVGSFIWLGHQFCLFPLAIIFGVYSVPFLMGLAVSGASNNYPFEDGDGLDSWFMFGDIKTAGPRALIFFILWTLQSALFFICAVVSIPSLYEVLCIYQPWLALSRGTQPAHKSVTLDYRTSWLPLVRAFRNKDTFVAVLAVLQFVPVVFPPIYGLLYIRQELMLWQGLEMTGPGQRFVWREGLDTEETGPGVFEQALSSLPRRLLSSQAWPVWSSADLMLLPPDLKNREHPFKSVKKGWGGAIASSQAHSFFTYETVALRARLECKEALAQLEMHPVSSASPGTSQRIERVVVSSIKSKSLPAATIQQPCALQESEASTAKTPGMKASKPEHMWCTRWWLDNTTDSLLPNSAPRRWIIVVLNGSASWVDNDKPYGELQFHNPPSTLAVECRSVLSLEPVKVTINTRWTWEEWRHLISDKFPPISLEQNQDHDNHTAAFLHESILAAVDHGLNHANMGRTNMPIIRTRSFVGDFMSWLMYRYQYAACLTSCVPNSTDLGAAVSRLFSAYVVAGLASDATGTAPLLTRTLGDSESTEPMKVRPAGPGDPSTFAHGYVFILLVLFFLLAAFLCGGLQAEMGASPWGGLHVKPAIASFMAIANGNLLDKLEEVAAFNGNIDKTSLHNLHRAIEKLQYRYRLVRGKGSAFVALDVSENWDDSEAAALELYRDSVDKEPGRELSALEGFRLEDLSEEGSLSEESLPGEQSSEESLPEESVPLLRVLD